MARGAALLILCCATTSGCAEGGPRVASASAGPPPGLCEVNQASSADGISLLGEVDSSPTQGVRVLYCHYAKTSGGPLPVREFPFRVRCPAGSRLSQPGFFFSGPTARRQRLAALIPNASSDGHDFVDVVVATDEPGALDVTTTALCRQ